MKHLLLQGDTLPGGDDIALPGIQFRYTGFSEDPAAYWQKIENAGQERENILPYILNDNIREVIKLALLLRRPILIKGEPGSGKTQLAKALAYQWHKDKSFGFRTRFFEWNVKSTSKAVDGLYFFDHLARLRDTQSEILTDKERAKEGKNYRKFGPLAKALLMSRKEDPAVLLIDEIDKADIDFPNDLLLELDENRFYIPETDESFSAKSAPLIMITSNEERELPQAFLRRCLFLYLQFPDTNQLNLIIQNQLPDLWKDHNGLVARVVEEFKKLQKRLSDDPSVTYRISTSNLIEVLTAIRDDPERKTADYKPEGFPNYFPVLLKSYAALITEKKITEKKEN